MTVGTQEMRISEEDSRRGMKQIGMEDWLIDAIMEFFSIVRVCHGSQTTAIVEEITGRIPIYFLQFARDYADSFALNPALQFPSQEEDI